MGSGLCTSSKTTALGELVAVTVEDTQPNTRPMPTSKDVPTPQTDPPPPAVMPQSALQYRVESTIPPGFHPSLQPSELELQCQAMVGGLRARDTDVPLRTEVREVLKEWEETQQLAEIENHALSIPANQTTNVKALAASLTSSHAKYVRSLGKNAVHLQLAKAYAIYYWVTNNVQYDVSAWQAYLSGDVSMKLTANSVLQRRETVCLGYARLFQALAREAGLQSEVVTGHVKLWRVLSHEGPGSRFEPNRQSAHDWNVVEIGGVWFPLDCTYGSGFVGPQMQFKTRYTRAYFAAPPEKLILTHLPSNEAWQLLQSPVTVEELRPLIAPQLQVFALGLEPEMWSESIHISENAADPVVSIHLKVKPGLRLSVRILDNESLDMQNVQTVSTSTSQGSYFIEQRESTTCISVVVPNRGHYTLTIHAYDPNLSAQHGHQERYQLCLTYQLTCNLDFRHSSVGYPIVHELAATAFDFKLLHWNTTQKAYICENSHGKLDVVFKAQSGLKYLHCLIPGRQKSLETSLPPNAHRFSTLLLHDVSDAALHTLRVIFPTEGWWTVYLCAARPSNVTGTVGFTSVLSCSFLAKASLHKHSYPELLSSECVWFESTEPIAAPGTEVLTVPFACTKPLHFYCCISHNNPTGDALEDYTRVVQSQDANPAHPVTASKYALRVIFPKPGKWYVSVMAKDSLDVTAESYFGLFRLCLEVEGATPNLFFPLVNKPVTDRLGIQLMDDDPVSFTDDGNPFVFNFLAPRNIKFMPKLKSSPDVGSPNGDDDCYVDYCTLLTSDTANPATYTLKVVFPLAKKWRVQLFAGRPESTQYNLAIQIDLDVKTPIPGVAYPKLSSAFHNFGFTIPQDNELYATSLTSPEFKLPFHGTNNMHLVWDMHLAMTGEKCYQNAFVHYPTEKSPTYLLHLVFSKTGDWVLQLYAGKAEADPAIDVSETYQLVMTLQLTALETNDTLIFPQLFPSFTNTFGLEIPKDSLPLVSRVANYPQSVVIPFQSLPNVQFWHEVQLDGKGYQEATRMTSDPATHQHWLEVEVTESGVWTVTLYARHHHTEEGKWTAVLRHTIRADQS